MEDLEYELNKPLSINEVYRIGGKICNMLLYPDMDYFSDIDELFIINNMTKALTRDLDFPENDNSVIINYVSEFFNPELGTLGGVNGHWCLLNRIWDGERYHYYFMDSYGMMPDEALSSFTKKERMETNQMKTKLLELIMKKLNEGEKFNFNDIQLQMDSNKISTCGRYCGLYLRNNDMTIEQFVQYLIDISDFYKIKPDLTVTFLTNDLLYNVQELESDEEYSDEWYYDI
jgi:hypothetical protein